MCVPVWLCNHHSPERRSARHPNGRRSHPRRHPSALTSTTTTTAGPAVVASQNSLARHRLALPLHGARAEPPHVATGTRRDLSPRPSHARQCAAASGVMAAATGTGTTTTGAAAVAAAAAVVTVVGAGAGLVLSAGPAKAVTEHDRLACRLHVVPPAASFLQSERGPFGSAPCARTSCARASAGTPERAGSVTARANWMRCGPWGWPIG